MRRDYRVDRVRLLARKCYNWGHFCVMYQQRLYPQCHCRVSHTVDHVWPSARSPYPCVFSMRASTTYSPTLPNSSTIAGEILYWPLSYCKGSSSRALTVYSSKFFTVCKKSSSSNGLGKATMVRCSSSWRGKRALIIMAGSCWKSGMAWIWSYNSRPLIPGR